MPSIRQLARDLGIGQITVRQAYDELTGRKPTAQAGQAMSPAESGG